MAEAAPATIARIDRILAEARALRVEQIEVHGFDEASDDRYVHGELASVAACYAYNASATDRYRNDVRQRFVETDRGQKTGQRPMHWPLHWSPSWFRPRDRRRDALKAIAMLVAEIERLDRGALRNAE